MEVGGRRNGIASVVPPSQCRLNIRLDTTHCLLRLLTATLLPAGKLPTATTLSTGKMPNDLTELAFDSAQADKSKLPTATAHCQLTLPTSGRFCSDDFYLKRVIRALEPVLSCFILA